MIDVMKNLPLHVRKWWDIANDRRQRLIVGKYQGAGLSRAQQNELSLLQKVAEEIMEYDSREIVISRIPKV